MPDPINLAQGGPVAPTLTGQESGPEAVVPLHEPRDMTVTTLAGEVVHFREKPTGLPAALASLSDAAEVLSQNAMDPDVAKVDWQEAVRMLDRLRRATDLIGSVHDALVMHVYLTGEHGDQEVEGVKGMVRIARGRDRRSWEVDRTALAVVEAKMQEREGEMPDPEEVVEWLLEVLHVDYARVTPMRGLGLDPKEFCQDRPGKVGVQLPPR